MKVLDMAPGTQVYAQDGAHLGTVVEVWSQTDAHGALPRSRHLFEDYGPIKGTAHLFDTDNGYLQVRRDDFLGSGGRTLYIPLDSVSRIGRTGSIHLQFSSSQSETRFVTQPEAVARRAA